MDDQNRPRRAVRVMLGVGLAIAGVNLLVAALLLHHDLGGPTGLLAGVLLFGAIIGLTTTRSSKR